MYSELSAMLVRSGRDGLEAEAVEITESVSRPFGS